MFAGETRSTGKVHPRPRYSALRPDIRGLHTHASLYIVAQLSQGFSLGEVQRDHAAPRKSEKKLTGSTLIGWAKDGQLTKGKQIVCRYANIREWFSVVVHGEAMLKIFKCDYGYGHI